MKIISIGTDRKMFEKDSAVRQRAIEYGKFFDESHIVVFLARNPKYPNYKYQISENVWVYPTNSINSFFYIVDAFLIIRKLIKNCKNFVVSAGDPFEMGVVGVLVKLFCGLPLHIQVHTDFMHKYFRQSSMLNRVRFLVAELTLRYADRVRAVSHRIEKSISGFSKNIDVLPIRAERKKTTEKIKKPFLFTLLAVCRLEKEKNIETILKAVGDLKDENIGLVIVGDGSLKSELKEISRNIGISNRVTFVGWKDDPSPYYEMADIFVSASLYEGYGISTVEAASFGKPLILSETGVAEDVFKDNQSALICDAKDSDCFAGNILKIREDMNLAMEIGKSAKTAAETHLKSEGDYFKNYADSIKKTTLGWRNKNFLSRLIHFKKTVFISFVAVRYFLCGITAAATNIVSLYIFTDIVGIWYLYSSVLAFTLSLFVSFGLQKFVVFEDRQTKKMHHQFSKFFVAAILGVIVNTSIIFVCVDVFGIWYIFSQIIAGFFVMIQNFILYKFFIFNRQQNKDE